MLDAFPPNAALFTADTELRRILMAKDRKPIPFISILNFGLPLLADARSVASESTLNSENPK